MPENKCFIALVFNFIKFINPFKGVLAHPHALGGFGYRLRRYASLRRYRGNCRDTRRTPGPGWPAHPHARSCTATAAKRTHTEHPKQNRSKPTKSARTSAR